MSVFFIAYNWSLLILWVRTPSSSSLIGQTEVWQGVLGGWKVTSFKFRLSHSRSYSFLTSRDCFVRIVSESCLWLCRHLFFPSSFWHFPHCLRAPPDLSARPLHLQHSACLPFQGPSEVLEDEGWRFSVYYVPSAPYLAANPLSLQQGDGLA